MFSFWFGTYSFHSGMNSYLSGIHSFRCNFSHSVQLDTFSWSIHLQGPISINDKMTMVMNCQIWWIADEIWWNMKSVQRKWFSSQIFYFRSLFSARAGRGLGAGEVFCPGTNEQWCRDIGQDWLSLLHQWKLNHGLVQSSFRGTEWWEGIQHSKF